MHAQGYSDDEYNRFLTTFIKNYAFCGDKLTVLVVLYFQVNVIVIGVCENGLE